MTRRFAAFFAMCALLAAPKQVRIEHAALHQFEDGPELRPDAAFVAGETVFFSCQLAGYQVTESEDDQKVALAWHIEVRDPAGVPLVEPPSGKIVSRVLPEDKEWRPKVRHEFLVPPHAGSGVYRITLTVKDELSGSEARQELAFRVRGHTVEPSPTLSIRNLHFLRSEEDAHPLAIAAYRPGETLWARFDMTGYRLGQNNRFDVDYGIAVLRANGEQMFSQPEAAAESGQSFYPRRWIPGALSLNLTKDLARGTYTLVVTVRDKVGGQTAETRHTFDVQ